MIYIASATRRGITGIAVLAVLLGAARAYTSTPHRAALARGAVYTPVALRRALTRAPAAWIGRTVWVRARAEHAFAWMCQQDYLCAVRRPSLVNPEAGSTYMTAGDAYLPLALPPEAPLWATLRRLPWMGRFVPPADAGVSWDAIALYRVRLYAAPSCADASCVDAVLAAGPDAMR